MWPSEWPRGMWLGFGLSLLPDPESFLVALTVLWLQDGCPYPDFGLLESLSPFSPPHAQLTTSPSCLLSP